MVMSSLWLFNEPAGAKSRGYPWRLADMFEEDHHDTFLSKNEITRRLFNLV